MQNKIEKMYNIAFSSSSYSMLKLSSYCSLAYWKLQAISANQKLRHLANHILAARNHKSNSFFVCHNLIKPAFSIIIIKFILFRSLRNNFSWTIQYSHYFTRRNAPRELQARWICRKVTRTSRAIERSKRMQKLGSLPPRRLQARILGGAVPAGRFPRRSFRNRAAGPQPRADQEPIDRPAMVRTPVTGSLSCDATESFVARARAYSYRRCRWHRVEGDRTMEGYGRLSWRHTW